MALQSLGDIMRVFWALGVAEVLWHQRGTLAMRVCDGDPGTHHSPQLIHLILQGLSLLGQAG